MAKFFDVISQEHKTFIENQHLFFVGSAPLSGDGHVNVSPKGMNCFRVLSDKQVGYVDLTGSGNETSAHLMENGRITLMFCSFDTAPMIMRLYGTGRAILPTMPEWAELATRFEIMPGARQIILAEVDQVQTSCGFAVPLYEFKEERPTLVKWAETKGDEALAAYRQEKNACSLDGLPTPIGALNN
jgi:hypothetical protein